MQWNKLFQRSFLILLNRTRRAALQGLFYYAPEMLLARSTCGAPFVSRVMEYTREVRDSSTATRESLSVQSASREPQPRT